MWAQQLLKEQVMLQGAARSVPSLLLQTQVQVWGRLAAA
jgi:hypothetical protein